MPGPSGHHQQQQHLFKHLTGDSVPVGGSLPRSLSASASSRSSGGRVSLQKLSSGKKARRVKFYRNGDKFFRGVVYVLQPDRTRTLDILLDDLNSILIDQVSRLLSLFLLAFVRFLLNQSRP